MSPQQARAQVRCQTRTVTEWFIEGSLGTDWPGLNWEWDWNVTRSHWPSICLTYGVQEQIFKKTEYGCKRKWFSYFFLFSYSSKWSRNRFISVRQNLPHLWTPFTYVWGGSRLWELLLAFSMTWQSGRPAILMQYVRHWLIANCWQGWWYGKSDLQRLELSRR